MREILFRGKRLDNGEWIYGSLFDGEHFTVIADTIMQSDWHKTQDNFRIFAKQVDPATVEQYTGMIDKNGVKVFEGDIIKAEDDLIGEKMCFIGVVEYKNGDFVIVNAGYAHFMCIDYKIEVIGNKLDNPEILET